MIFPSPKPHYNPNFEAFDLVSSSVWWEIETNINTSLINHWHPWQTASASPLSSGWVILLTRLISLYSTVPRCLVCAIICHPCMEPCLCQCPARLIRLTLHRETDEQHSPAELEPRFVVTFSTPNPYYNPTFESFDLVSSSIWWEVEKI